MNPIVTQAYFSAEFQSKGQSPQSNRKRGLQSRVRACVCQCVFVSVQSVVSHVTGCVCVNPRRSSYHTSSIHLIQLNHPACDLLSLALILAALAAMNPIVTQACLSAEFQSKVQSPQSNRKGGLQSNRVCECVCVCVCERERECL